MKKAQRYNPSTRTYEPYELPKGTILYTPDLDKKVACAQCGKLHTFGEMYTSKQIHTEVGFGYPVCERCYLKELAEEKAYGDKRR